MCLKKIIDRLLKKSPHDKQTGDGDLYLTHPEEAANPDQTIENVSVPDIITKWLTDWKVPAGYWDYWRSMISVTVADDVSVAYSWEADGKRYIKVNPVWLNPGVIAHEQAHNSYALLTPKQKADFEKDYTPLISTDSLIKYLYSINNYGLTSVIEGHAEVYRYLTERMPGQLKKYYPKLL